ncbi:MAG: ABC-type multidrug transport system, ATPase component [Gammaproteobacteria bacterium]|nr:ABC-type multidrug transport system, ATPase component [Gammaproteobacteria bacterium]
MTAIVQASGIVKRYGDMLALNNVNLDIEPGKIVGLIGLNGAGKTTLLKCLLGLAACDGEIQILGFDPVRQRTRMLEEVCFIADTAILPRWLKVSQALEYLEHVHPRFNRELAETFLKTTVIKPDSTIKQLSKGMITQLHLALVMAIDARLLILDEPTLGLDILYRKQFYTRLIHDYFDHERTILVTTHQVEEIESLLTDLLFIRDGSLVLKASMDELPGLFIEVHCRKDQLERARALGPLNERPLLGGYAFIFENRDRAELESLGELRTPGVADLFVAKMQGKGGV